jgi:hypothetical protein
MRFLRNSADENSKRIKVGGVADDWNLLMKIGSRVAHELLH